MGYPLSFKSGTIPQSTDTEWDLLVKLIIAEGGGSGGGGASQEVFPGHYGGVAPLFTPPKAHAMAPDLDAPFVTWIWNPDSSAWQ